MSRQRFLHFVSALALVGGLVSLQAAYSPVLALSPSQPAALRQAAAVHQVARSGEFGRPRALFHESTTGSRLGREVFGFALASSLSDPTVGYPSWNFSALSTVAFFGLHINWDGTIIADSGWSVWSSSALTNLLTTAHASSAKVVLTIVLQDFQPGTPNMCAGLINRATTVTQTVAQVVAKHVDGVNIDYEGLNGTCQNGQTARAMFTDFAHRVRGALPSGSYLSVDSYASSAADSLGFFDVPSLNKYVDSFFVMAYDLEYSNYHRAPAGCTRFCLGPTAPLAGYYYNDTSTASQYTKVVGASKVILGVPYYGRKACVGGVAPNAYPIGDVTADSYLSASGESTDPAVAPGSYTAHRDSNDPSGHERWDTWFNTTLKCTRELYWDDVTSLGAKYDLVNRDGLRGVGIWNLNYGGGAPELWLALLNHFGGCPSVAVSSSPASTAPVGTAVTLTATASSCANPAPRLAFWLQAPGSTTWQLVQQYSTTNTFNWNTTGKPVGTYRFSVWALDAGSTGVFGNSLGRWDSYVATQYVLTPTRCGSVSAAFSPSAGAVVGAPVAITGTGVGCPNPHYEFWMLAPGATSWRLGQAYSTTATFNWKTGAPAGVYHFSVWARDASSTGTASNSLGSWDAYAVAQYTLIAPCSSVGVSTSPPAATPVGTAVAITGAAVSCPSPLYQFWMLPPGSTSWQLAQAYSASATYSWNTTGLATGVYQFSVWARDSHGTGTSGNSLGRWDAYKAVQYRLFTPCSAVSAVFTPPTSAKTGTAITVTASASGCRYPLYAFWILAPGSSKWLLAQSYSTKATFSWSTTGKPKGTYQFSIWARDSSSHGVVGDSLGRWDAYKSSSYVLS